MGSFVKVGSQTAANEQQRGTFVEVSTGKEIERNQEPAHSSPVVSKTTSSPVKSGVSKKKSAKTTAQPVKKTAAPLKAPKTTAKKVIRVPVKKTDPSAYGYDPMVAQDLENRQKQTSALKPGAKPFSAGKLAGDLAMRGMNQFAGFFSSGLAMAEDAGGYAAGLLTGQPGVNLAEGGIFNTWDQAIKREGQAMEQSAAKNVAKGGKAAETVYKYGTQTVAAVPQAVLAMLTGGGSAVASSASLAGTAAKALSPSLARAISQAVSGMAKNPQYWTSFAQVVGPGYQQALEDGADHAHAALYAVGNGLLNAAVEIGGGVQKLPGALKGGTQTWKAIVDSMLEEGQEEVVQGIIERALQNVAYDQKNPLASASNPRAVLNPRTALEEFKGGAVVGGILGGGQAAVQAGINSYAQNQVQKHLDMMQSIVKERAAEIQSIQKQAEQEARDWVDSLDLPRPVDLNAVNAQADQDASAIVRDMFSQKPVQPTSPESVMKIIQDIQREQQARPGSILLNGDQLTQINQEITKQQAATVDVDSLLKGRARLDYEQLAPDTQAAVDRAYEQGTAGMDAEGRIFRINPEDHIDRRDAADVGRRRSLNAFQFDHPELHRFFADAAQWLKSGMGQKGGQIESAPDVLSDGVTPSSHDRYWRTSRMQPEPVVRLLDEFGLSYAEIDKALDAIIKDKGQENYAAAKKVELVLDEMLTNGWTDLDGRFLPGIPEYVDATSKIAGSLNAEQEPDLGIMGQEIDRLYGKPDSDGLGAADAGFTTREFQGAERTSRMAGEQPYTRQQGEATGMTREEYNRIFRYQSQTEGRTTALAEELLYFVVDGRPAFLRDVDPVGYQELTDSLREATAWNAEQMEAGRMILTELYGRSLNMEIEETEYSEWLDQVRQHETATGQGVQAISKWVRGDNNRGQRTLDDTIRRIQENQELPPEERRSRIRDIIDLTDRINSLDETQSLNLRDIILEIAEMRGVLTGFTGIMGQTRGTVRRGRAVFGKAMEGVPFNQLRQFAFASVEALGTDTQHVNPGDVVKTIQVLNMLSSLKTPGRNLTGNIAFYAMDALAMDGAALLDTALAHATGTRSVSRGGTPVDRAMWYEAIQSAKMSILETALDVDMGRGETMYGTGGRRTFRSGTDARGLERGRLGFAGRFFSAMERNNSYLLTVPDEFFKGMARSHRDRLQRLVASGRISTDNADYAAEQAEALARYRTFQDNGAAAVISTTIHDLLNLLPGIGDSGNRIRGMTVHSAGLGDIASPFARVAANLASRAVDYNPVAAARGVAEIGRILYDAQQGGQTIDPTRQARAVSNTARGLTGSAIIGVFLMALTAGLIRRADDEGDDDVASLNKSEGRSGNQFNLSAFDRWRKGESATWQNGDKLLDISSLQPFNELLGVAEQIYKDEDKTAGSLLKDDLLGMMYAAAEIPMLETTGNLGKDLLLYRKDPVESFSQAAGKTVVSSLTPNLVNSVAVGLDDRPRAVDRENGLLKLMLDTVKSRTPGLRQTLPGSVDPVGQDRTYPGSKVGHFLNSTLNPLGLNTYNQSEQSQEWQRLREETGRTDFYPSASVNKTLEGTNRETGEKTSRTLTYQERQELQRKRGLWLMPTVMEVMGNRSYQSYDAERQADLMKDVESFASSAAKAQTLGKDYVDKWVSKTLDAQESTGLPPGAVLIYRDLKNRDSGMENERLRQLIRADSSLSTAQKNALDDLLLTDGFWVPQHKDVDYSSDESFALSQMSDSAQRHWEYVRDRTGISSGDYQTAWSICNRSEKGYHKEDRIRDLMNQLGISKPEANRIWNAVKKDLDE